MAQHGTPNHLARQVFHCSYNSFLVKTLTQWSPNVKVARYKLLYVTFVTKQDFRFTQRESNGDVFWQSLFFLHHLCLAWLLRRMRDFSPNSLLRRLETVLGLTAVPFKRKIARVFFQELFGERSIICLIERSSLGVVFCGRPDLFLS